MIIKLYSTIRFFSTSFFVISLIVIIYIVIKYIRFDNVVELFFVGPSRIFKKRQSKFLKLFLITIKFSIKNRYLLDFDN